MALLRFQMAPKPIFLISFGSRKKEPRYICLSDAKASHSHNMWVEVSSFIPRFLHRGLSSKPSRCRCLLRVLWPVRRPVTALAWVLLKVKNLALVTRLGPGMSSRACLWVFPKPWHWALCWLTNLSAGIITRLSFGRYSEPSHREGMNAFFYKLITNQLHELKVLLEELINIYPIKKYLVFYSTRNFFYHFQKTPPLIPILTQASPCFASPLMSLIFIASSHLNFDLPSCLFRWSYFTKSWRHFSSCSCVLKQIAFTLIKGQEVCPKRRSVYSRQ